MNTPLATSAARASECDVLVIGGGPAGSTAAALLAERGYRVTLSEKAHHPRFHKFCAPFCAASLLNFRRTLKAWRVRKHNIRVVDETGTAMR